MHSSEDFKISAQIMLVTIINKNIHSEIYTAKYL